MPCYHPITAYRTAGGDITFRQGHGVGSSITLPCGGCIGCRLERSRQWAVRCMHEASLHDANMFLTLTYDDEHLPYGATLVKRHMQLFFKSLRKRLSSLRISYYMCGEYGDEGRRPHYHALIFGYTFPDKIFHKFNDQGDKIFVSPILDKLWGQGYCYIGSVTFKSAGYVARYCLKKVTGKQAAAHYQVVNRDTGEITELVPEYAAMSLKPGIGKRWFQRFGSEVFPDDFIISKGRKLLPPRYYGRLHEADNPDSMAAVKLLRVRFGSRHKSESLPDRLAVREAVKVASITFLKRS